MSTGTRNAVGLALLMWLLATITIGMQTWLGDETIYSKELTQKREELHFAILNNKAPGGDSWAAVGGLSIQKRVGVVYLAEVIREKSGLAVGKVYKLLDSVFLFISLVSLFFYLRRWLPDVYCLIGVLYFCAVLPATYFFQLFHPWDRLQLAIWIGLLYLVSTRRYFALSIGLIVSIFIKFDTVLLPVFYLLVHFTRARWLRTSVEFSVLLILAFGAYFTVGQMFPDPLDASRYTLDGVSSMSLSNWTAFVEMNVRYPPALVFSLPLFLSCFFLCFKDRYVWVSVVFALTLTAVHLLLTHFEEVRAYMVVLVLIMPSALISLRCFVEPGCFNTAKSIRTWRATNA